MKRFSSLLMLCVALALPVYTLQAEEGGEKGEAQPEAKGKAEKVELKDLPKAVVEAAQKAVAGIELTSAVKATRGDVVLYEIQGKVGDKPYELVITADGKVLRSGEKKAEKAEKADGKEKADQDDDGDGDDDKNDQDDKDDENDDDD